MFPALVGRRILIAEDVATNQMLLTAVLAPTGADVEVVANGAEVLKRHSEAPADMILMDLQMPGRGGIAAMRELRAMGGELATVPVLALTAYARSADRQLAHGRRNGRLYGQAHHRGRVLRPVAPVAVC